MSNLVWSGVDIDNRSVEARIQVDRANLLQTLKHDRLIYEGTQLKITDPDELTARLFLFPTCIASSSSIEIIRDGSPIDDVSFDEFCSLPPDLVDQWVSMAFEANPRWRATPETDEKKA